MIWKTKRPKLQVGNILLTATYTDSDVVYYNGYEVEAHSDGIRLYRFGCGTCCAYDDIVADKYMVTHSVK